MYQKIENCESNEMLHHCQYGLAQILECAESSPVDIDRIKSIAEVTLQGKPRRKDEIRSMFETAITMLQTMLTFGKINYGELGIPTKDNIGLFLDEAVTCLYGVDMMAEKNTNSRREA